MFCLVLEINLVMNEFILVYFCNKTVVNFQWQSPAFLIRIPENFLERLNYCYEEIGKSPFCSKPSMRDNFSLNIHFNRFFNILCIEDLIVFFQLMIDSLHVDLMCWRINITKYNLWRKKTKKHNNLYWISVKGWPMKKRIKKKNR